MKRNDIISIVGVYLILSVFSLFATDDHMAKTYLEMNAIVASQDLTKDQKTTAIVEYFKKEPCWPGVLYRLDKVDKKQAVQIAQKLLLKPGTSRVHKEQLKRYLLQSQTSAVVEESGNQPKNKVHRAQMETKLISCTTIKKMPSSEHVPTTSNKNLELKYKNCGEKIGGLELNLIISQNKNIVGDPIIAKVEFKNLSSESMLIYQGYHTGVTTSFKIYDSKGKLIKYQGYLSGVGLRYPSFIPGTNKHSDRTGHSMCSTTYDLAKEYKLLKPGKYKISVEFHSGDGGTHPEIMTKETSIWSGKLLSNIVEIEVLEKTK